MSRLKSNWSEYLYEGLGLLNLLVVSALLAAIIVHPGTSLHNMCAGNGLSVFFLVDLLINAFLICLMFCPFGARSGSHLNPAITLSCLRLGKIGKMDALFYIAFQILGMLLGVIIVRYVILQYSKPEISSPYFALPPESWILPAFLLEAVFSFLFFLVLLYTCNHKSCAPYTGVFLMIFLTLSSLLELPYWGLSINPVQSVTIALISNTWTHIWIYFLAPVVGMIWACEFFCKYGNTCRRNIKIHTTIRRYGLNS